MKRRKIVGVVWDLPVKQHSQPGPFPTKLDWIGCAIQQANPKRLYTFFSLPGIIFLKFFRYESTYLHFCHILFQLQLVRYVIHIFNLNEFLQHDIFFFTVMPRPNVISITPMKPELWDSTKCSNYKRNMILRKPLKRSL